MSVSKATKPVRSLAADVAPILDMNQSAEGTTLSSAGTASATAEGSDCAA